MNIFNLFKRETPKSVEETLYKIGWQIRDKNGFTLTSAFPNINNLDKDDIEKKVKDQIKEMQNELEQALVEKKHLVNLNNNVLFADEIKSITFFIEYEK